MKRPPILHRVTSLALGAALAFRPASPLAAQTDQEPWRDSYYPVIAYSGNDGVSFGARYLLTQRAEYNAPYFHRGAMILDASASASGSYLASARFRAPGLARGWRFDLHASAAKQTRYEFYGLGEDARYHADSVADAQPYYYKVRRAQRQVKGELSRRLVGRWWLTGMAQWKQTDFTDLPGPSIFTATFGSSLSESDLLGRIGLVYDTRDNEYDTHRGVLLDVGMTHGTGEGDGYDRWVAEARGWVPFGEWNSTWLSSRVVASDATGDLPLDARLYLPVWEGQVRVLGGAESHRGMLDQRYVGRGLLVGNLTLHHDLFNAGGLMAGG
ncbi:MAG TPA: BamA/TamA family outer membrane protein, partial [Gemmatimonadales bacterium]|nr:BamA/TamA family outer membrane protein [Gemmatimonadales bacterium]